MSARVVIAGAGGFGRELLGAILASPTFIREHDIDDIVYLNDSAPTIPVRRQVVGTIAEYRPHAGDLVLVAVGNSRVRRGIVSTLRNRGASFATFVHDRAVIGENVRIGEGTVVCADVRMTADVHVGAFVQINVNCSIGHDVTIGDFTTLSANCDLTGGVTVGTDAFFGTGATIAPGKAIGDRAAVGIGSVVIRNVTEDTTVFGNPAVAIGRRT